MRMKENFFDYSSIFIIFFVSILFAYVVGSGFYGYGNDFYALYHKSNLNWGGWSDYIGYRISTFSVNENHYGVYLVTGILAFSTGLILKNFFKKKKIYSIFFFITIYSLAIHSWPVIMSTSNAMRQGISMSLIFISLSYLINKQFTKSIFFILLSIFTHKSGVFFVFIFFNMVLINSIFYSLKISYPKGFIYLLFGISILIASTYILKNNLSIDNDHRIIGGDYRIPFFIINIITIVFFTIRNDLLRSNDIYLFLYLFNFVAISLLFLGFNWQYERLNMMMTIPYILIAGILFTKRSTYLIWSIFFVFLLFLTINNGMYASLN